MSIRFKVILPYLLLTLLIAITGVYVVTQLVTNSLSERLTNQLLEAGRVVSDDIARQEIKHIENARYIALTRGVAEAMRDGEWKVLGDLVQPSAAGLGVENIVIINTNGREIMHLIQQPDKTLVSSSSSGLAGSLIVEELLTKQNPDSLPQRALLQDAADQRYYHFTSTVISLDGEMVGIIVTGTSLDTLLPYMKNTSLADVILYDSSGKVIGTTFGAQSADLQKMQELSITPQLASEIIISSGNISGEDFQLEERWYRIARSPMQISDDRIGVFAVVLPLDFVIQPGTASRNNYVVLFSIAMLLVVAIGYGISRLITNPLFSLVRTSQAIAGGDLAQRTGIQSSDEIGALANTFDAMTESLQQRTIELEKANQILEQMDHNKSSFIQVAGHELRSPLTVINAYAQILEKSAQDNPELAPVSKGILDGTTRMTAVVNSMLDISRIDSKALKVIPENLLLAPIVKKVEKKFASAWEERNINLTVKGLEDLPRIAADPDLLEKVFYHLIMNAIKYTPDGGSITVVGRVVTGETEIPQVEITVSDTGIGIDPQFKDLIFEKFFQTGEIQLHSSGRTNFKGGGPGLGLAIVKGIIEAHGGQVWVESPGFNEEKCPGSQFFVRLPLVETTIQ